MDWQLWLLPFGVGLLPCFGLLWNLYDCILACIKLKQTLKHGTIVYGIITKKYHRRIISRSRGAGGGRTEYYFDIEYTLGKVKFIVDKDTFGQYQKTDEIEVIYLKFEKEIFVKLKHHHNARLENDISLGMRIWFGFNFGFTPIFIWMFMVKEEGLLFRFSIIIAMVVDFIIIKAFCYLWCKLYHHHQNQTTTNFVSK